MRSDDGDSIFFSLVTFISPSNSADLNQRISRNPACARKHAQLGEVFSLANTLVLAFGDAFNCSQCSHLPCRRRVGIVGSFMSVVPSCVLFVFVLCSKDSSTCVCVLVLCAAS